MEHSHSPVTEDLAELATEQQDPAGARLDEMGSLEIVRLMNAEDAGIARAVEAALPQIARMVDQIVDRMTRGGRLFYVGAGTSGRLAALDAVECPPTFGADPDQVQCLLAGGPEAWARAKEGVEDDASAGAGAVEQAGLTPADILVGVAASGRTPFVRGAIGAARERGCVTGIITNHPGSLLGKLADIAIEIPVGPEVLTGSTRLKAGTAQKMALNMLTTAAFAQMGKVYGSLMVDMRATNSKLRDRAQRIVAAAAGVSDDTAARLIDQAGGSAKTAIAMSRLNCDRAEAERLLCAHGGSLRAALES
ncbi:MAG TPA: N-acetylmuramic acid 6-phosphate etherase [Armatimonadota bacterium]|nr:N-acetylmuramic acid 6-phosphate etherase [Armatimonadota bacterium]